MVTQKYINSLTSLVLGSAIELIFTVQIYLEKDKKHTLQNNLHYCQQNK